MSRPIVVTLGMLPSSESWSPQRRPPQGHLRAGGGAVHSIRSGPLPNRLQHIEQVPGLLQIECVEALSKPPIDWSEKFPGFVLLALSEPQPGHAHRGAQFP